ncbi:MAG: glycosyltransferase family 2 protein [Pseudomonadota bacterium]|nr:glycosyltransferase family 2 protein [Pseudomonadota bacterium]
MLQQKHTCLHISAVTYDTERSELTNTIDSVMAAAKLLRTSRPDVRICLTVVNNNNRYNIDSSEFDTVLSNSGFDISALRLIQGHINVGYGCGQNMAFFGQHSKYHLFLNPDVELDPGCLLAGIDYLEQNPDVGLAGPCVVNRAGVKQFLCKRYPTVLDLLLRGFTPKVIRRFFDARLARYEMHDLSETEPQKDIPITSGCFLLCRSRVVSQIGGFDPKFFLYFEDFDLCMRAGKVSRVAYLPSMRIRHFGGNTARKGLRHILFFMVSAIRFFTKHGWQWVRQR